MQIHLDCGRTVIVDSLHYNPTYAGLLIGRPTADLNHRIIEASRTAMASAWGSRNTYVIPPAIDSAVPAHPQLPEDQLILSLTCIHPTHPQFMGSQLVVVVFVNGCWDRPMSEVLHESLRTLPWHDLADDFDY